MSKILIADDDPNIRELVQTLLRDTGFEVGEAANGQEALDLLYQEHFDLCIIDIMMPGMDGYELCRKIRKFFDYPVLMLTAKNETRQKVQGFEAGTDDYLTKPFAGEELVVRVQALLKRYQIVSKQKVSAGKLVVDKHSMMVMYDNKKEDIPLKEFELLFMLASYAGKTLDRDRLIEEIWGYDFDGNERTLDVHIGRLRDRFPECDYGFRIKTIRGIGYRLEEVWYA